MYIYSKSKNFNQAYFELFKKRKKLKDKSGVKWIWDMFYMITKWDVHLGAKK